MATATQTPNTNQSTEVVKKAPTSVIAIAQTQIENLVANGRLEFPQDYSVQNALVAAKLQLQNVCDKDKRPVVDQNGNPTGVCTTASMVNAVVSMCVQGMNVAKDQGYFIVYGQELTFQRSYHGEEALAMRVLPGSEVYAAAVHEGDLFKFSYVHGLHYIEKHESSLENLDKPVIAAYCGITIDNRQTDLGALVMTIADIKRAWSMSKTYKYATKDKPTPHITFEASMAVRTVTRKRCSKIYRTSSDEMLKRSIEQQEDEAILAQAAEEAEEHANGEMLSIPLLPPATEQGEPQVSNDQDGQGKLDPGF